MQSKLIKYTTPVIFSLLGILIYSNVLNSPFIFDDEMYITDNYQIRDISNLLNDFSGTRYIGFLSFAINYYFGGLNTFGYHLVNVIIHILNAILVYFLVSLTFKTGIGIGKGMGKDKDISSPIPLPDFIAFSVSLIFLVHPIQTQAVSYITQRFTSLATFFYLLALVLYIKARLKGTEAKRLKGRFNLFPFSPLYLLSLFSAVLAMKTKEISFTLPFVIFLYEFTFFSNQGLRIKSRLLYLLPFLLTLLIIPLTFLWAQNIGGVAPAHDVGEMIMKLQLLEMKDLSRYTYLMTQFRVIITYMRLLILPVNQIFEYDFPLSKSLFEPSTFISVLFILSTLVFTIHLYVQSLKKDNGLRKIISFGILWFFITLSIESSIISIKDVIFEHRLYLPSVGFILSATTSLFYGFGYLEKRLNRPLWNHVLATVIIAAFVLSFATYKRNILWSDSYLMHLDNVNKAPNRAVPHNNLGNAYNSKGQYDRAIEDFKKAIALDPNLVLAYNNRGIAYALSGNMGRAISDFQKACDLGFEMGCKNLQKALKER